MPHNPPWDSAAVRRLGAAQDRMASRDQLAALGVCCHHVAHREDTGLWQTVGPRVVVLSGGALSRRQQEWAAVLHGGPGAVLSGLSAAVAGGLTGFPTETLQITVPHGRRVADLDHPAVRVRVRQSRGLCAEHIHPVAAPPRLRLPYAVVLAAVDAVSDERARLLILSAVQQRLVRPADLRRAVTAPLRLPRRGLLVESVDDAEGGIHSLPEREWTVAIRRAHLPEPTRQRRLRRPNGTWYLDAEFDPWQVSAEINGAQHEAVVAAESDDHRRNVVGTAGRLVITLSSYAVRHTPGRPVVATAAALLSRGWSPTPRILAGLERAAEHAGMDLRTGDYLR